MKTLSVLALLLPAAQDSSQKQEVLNKLATQRITLQFDKASPDEVIRYIRDFSGLNIIVHPEVHQRLSEDQLRFTIKVKDLRLKSALKLLLGQRNLTAIYKEGVLVVVPQDRVRKAFVTRVYDVRDLLFRIRDFPGPKVELTAPGSGGGGVTGATFSIEEEPKSTISEDFLTEIIQANTGGNSWSEGGSASITLTNGLLIVTQSIRTHGEVLRLLNLLRQFK